MSVELSINEIMEILGARSFQSLVGRGENEIFDAKLILPTDYSDPNDRIELAKDVSSFANAEGGYIITGLRTTSSKEEKRDFVTDLALLKESDFVEGAIVDVVRSAVEPKISGLDVDWIPSKNDSSLGLGYIYIPPQEEDRKYFLMKSVIVEGEVLKPIAFGLARRRGSDSIPLDIRELYEAVNRGKRPNSIRLEEIGNKVSAIWGTISTMGKTEQDEEDRQKKLAGYIASVIKNDD